MREGRRLERIADGEMVAHAFLEAGDVVVARLARLVGQVQADAHVETDDQEVHVVANAEARAQRQVFQEASGLEAAAGAVGIVAHQPDVAAVEEGGPTQVAHDGEAILQVGLELDVARAVDVGILVVVAALVVAARSDAADGEGAHTVGAADIELLVVRSGARVAIAIDGARHDAPHEVLLVAQEAGVARLGRSFYKLSEGVAEEVFALLGERLARDGIGRVHQQARLRDGALQEEVVAFAGDGRIVVGVGITHRRDKLVLQTLHQRLVAAGYAVELGRGALQ